jgi:hypothetical protein
MTEAALTFVKIVKMNMHMGNKIKPCDFHISRIESITLLPTYLIGNNFSVNSKLMSTYSNQFI